MPRRDNPTNVKPTFYAESQGKGAKITPLITLDLSGEPWKGFRKPLYIS